MRPTLCGLVLLFTNSLLPAADTPVQPPAPPPVTYEVWGFKWDGHRYVKQTNYSYRTTDLAAAQNFATQVMSYAGWSATTNIPEACVVQTVFHGPGVSRVRPSAIPAGLTYDVWAFRLEKGQWVKDEAHSWRTTDPMRGSEYAREVNAVAGWRAMTNCPAPIPASQRFVDGGRLHGADHYSASHYGAGRIRRFGNGYPVSGFGNWDAFVQSMIARYKRHPNSNERAADSSEPSPTVDVSPTYDNSADIQNMINTQNMINNQMMLNNIQDMVNTQNMVNSLNANP